MPAVSKEISLNMKNRKLLEKRKVIRKMEIKRKIYEILQNKKQYVRINNIYSNIGVSQGSIAGPVLFNSFLNGFFYFIRNTAVRNFVDDNILFAFPKTVIKLNRTFDKSEAVSRGCYVKTVFLKISQNS